MSEEKLHSAAAWVVRGVVVIACTTLVTLASIVKSNIDRSIENIERRAEINSKTMEEAIRLVVKHDTELKAIKESLDRHEREIEKLKK